MAARRTIEDLIIIVVSCLAVVALVVCFCFYELCFCLVVVETTRTACMLSNHLACTLAGYAVVVLLLGRWRDFFYKVMGMF